MIGTVKISGPIGANDAPAVGDIGGTLINILEQFKKLPQGTRIVNVEISSPGGLVDEGDFIYNYLISEKKNYVVNTVQVGDIASIATKLFMAGDSRTADPSKKFMIHNPWVDPGAGDSNHQADVLEALTQAEDSLRKFYSKELGISEEGLAPLMDAETYLTGDQLITLGFATQLKNRLVMAAMKTPGAKPVNLMARAIALLKKVKAEGAIKSLDVSLMDGTTLTVDAPNEDSLMGAPATIDGNPAPDGDYVAMPDAEDGNSATGDTITVKGGVVTAVTEPAQAAKPPVPTPTPAPAPAADDRIANLESAVGQLVDAVGQLMEANKAQLAAAEKAVEDKVEARIVALKNEISSTHEPKRAATVYANSVAKEQNGFKSINERMAEKREARKAAIR